MYCYRGSEIEVGRGRQALMKGAREISEAGDYVRMANEVLQREKCS